jgi:predicted aspartyl protease
MPIYEVAWPPEILKSRGPILPIEISIPKPLVDYLTAKGESIPSPVKGNALVDTGASISVVDLEAISQLNIKPIGVAEMHTVGGKVNQNLFPARFIIPNLTIDFEAVAGADLKPQGIVALIGRDILSGFVLIYLGGTGRFLLCF